MGDYSKYKNVNTTFGGTEGIILPIGNTSERENTLGRIRYNSQTGYVEQYNSEGWTAIATPPQVLSFTGTLSQDTDATLTITGTNFVSGCVVSIEGAGVSGVARNLTTTFVSNAQVQAATNGAAVNFVGGASYNVRVTNPNGLSGVLSPAGVVDQPPVWGTGSGSLGTVFDSARGSASFTLSATDPDGDSVTYSVVSGSVPTGSSLDTNTGVISGFNAVGSDTTSNFTVRATSRSYTQDRSFSIAVKAPVVQQFTSTGSSTFNVPTGVTSVRVLVVGAGGGGGANIGGGGGAGGVVKGNTPVTPGGTVAVTVGSGGSRVNGRNVTAPSGGNSSFGSITAIGGGGGGGGGSDGEGPGVAGHSGRPGGSGGGGGGYVSTQTLGTSTQSPSGGLTGYGNNGGIGNTNHAGGGGGGAGGAGQNSPSGSTAGNGGIGITDDITGSNLYWGGGGGGATYNNNNKSGNGGLGGGGGGGNNGSNQGSGGGSALNPGNSGTNAPTPATTQTGGDAGTNTGGGGGAASHEQNTSGLGGPGIVVVRY